MGEDDFSILLKTYRRSMGWSQAALAQHWDYSLETVSAWERRKRNPSNTEIPRLAKLLEMEPNDLADRISQNRQSSSKQRNVITTNHPNGKSWQTSFETWGELQQIYRTRTEFNRSFSYPRMFENAKTILATGISLNAIAMNYSRTELQEIVTQTGNKFQLCFLQPDGKHCAEREIEEDLPTKQLTDLTSINMNVMLTLHKHIAKVAPTYANNLEIRTYDLIPRFNIFIVNDEVMTVQSYGYGRGEDTPTLVLRRQTKGGLFDFYSSIALHVLDTSSLVAPNVTRSEE